MVSLAKTDGLDAEIIALFAEHVRPELRPEPDAATEALGELAGRRRQIAGMIAAETMRRQQAGSPPVRKNIDATITLLSRQRDAIDHNFDKAICANDHFSCTEDLLISVPGVGKTITRFFIVDMPELGSLDRHRIAGVAPFSHDSGTHRGGRSIRGGRGSVRAAMFVSAWVASKCNTVIKEFYQRLLAAGKHASAPWSPACVRC